MGFKLHKSCQTCPVWPSYSTQFYLYSNFNYRPCHKAFTKIWMYIKFPNEQARGNKLLETTQGRILARNWPQKGTVPILGDIRHWDYNSLRHAHVWVKSNSTKCVVTRFSMRIEWIRVPRWVQDSFIFMITVSLRMWNKTLLWLIVFPRMSYISAVFRESCTR